MDAEISGILSILDRGEQDVITELTACLQSEVRCAMNCGYFRWADESVKLIQTVKGMRKRKGIHDN